MKSLRRSLNSKDSHNGNNLPLISAPISSLPPVSRPNQKTQPPKKVIRASETYRPKAPQELPFSKGDFFHVVKDSEDNSGWYEAHNPMTGARGLVPKHLFEEFTKPNAASRNSTFSRSSTSLPSATPSADPRTPQSPRSKNYFAVVQHNFQAERPDELDARQGDHVQVVAQSNREWFVAKPIGKLGRPGLIPATFVELKDPLTGNVISEAEVGLIMDRGDIPRVEDWKKAMIAYKAASIPLGVIDDNSIGPVPNSPFVTSSSQQSGGFPGSNNVALVYPPTPPPPAPEHPNELPTNNDKPPPNPHEPLPFGILASAEVVSFHFEDEEYWFRINATWQPLDRYSLNPVGGPHKLVLFRVYNDFYDFQIQLLDAFAKEAGRAPDPNSESGSSSRILPYMPGPVDQVDDIVTSLRQEELDQYLIQLCGLGQIGAEHVLQHDLVRQFFTCRSGDVETLEEGIANSLQDPGNNAKSGLESFSSLNVGDSRQNRYPPMRESNGSDYGLDNYDPQQRSRNQAAASSSNPGEVGRGYNSGAMLNSPVDSQLEPSSASTNELWSDTMSQSFEDSSRGASAVSPPPRLRAISDANTPPISATNPQTAFIKIKIFDRTSDDLIAIRVSPRVSHRQLMDKVQERLGAEVSRLNYRNSLNTGFIPLHGDDDLRTWLEQTDKHVLYAE